MSKSIRVPVLLLLLLVAALYVNFAKGAGVSAQTVPLMETFKADVGDTGYYFDGHRLTIADHRNNSDIHIATCGLAEILPMTSKAGLKFHLYMFNNCLGDADKDFSKSLTALKVEDSTGYMTIISEYLSVMGLPSIFQVTKAEYNGAPYEVMALD